MIQELLLVFSCVSNSGCSETTQAYTNYNKDTIRNVENTAKAVERSLPEPITHVLLPIYNVYTARAVIFSVNRHTILGVSNENLSISFNYEY